MIDETIYITGDRFGSSKFAFRQISLVDTKMATSSSRGEYTRASLDDDDLIDPDDGMWKAPYGYVLNGID